MRGLRGLRHEFIASCSATLGATSTPKFGQACVDRRHRQGAGSLSEKNFATFKVAAELEICAMAQQRQHRSLSAALPRRRP